jgi:uncharacterized protein YyaL (SSP411 family)
METMRKLLAALCVLAGIAASAAVAATPPPLPSHGKLVADRSSYLRLSQQGLQQTKQLWWNSDLGWYNDFVDDQDHLPLARLWSAYGLFEATDAVAVAAPTTANKTAVTAFATYAERYWDPKIGKTGAYLYYPNIKDAAWDAYMDDNGWWGLGFLDAYRATGNARWVRDAARALLFMDRYGWDRKSGGMWWDADQHKKTSEGLAAATLIAAKLYTITHKASYLKLARKYLAWANAHTRNPRQHNLYGRSATDGTVMNYVEGMFVAAHAELCAATKSKSYCTKAEQLANAALQEFPVDADWAPETDTIYLRWMLDLYEHDHNPRWYALAYRNAQRAVANARDSQGLWSQRWDGQWTKPGQLRTQGGTLALLAWVAAVKPPLSAR